MPSNTPGTLVPNPEAYTTMSPFQMRYEVLHLAKDILEQNAHMAREDKATDRKTYYTLDEVIATATELNKFISNKG